MIALLTALITLAPACGGGGKVDSTASPTTIASATSSMNGGTGVTSASSMAASPTTTAALRPADEVRAEQDTAKARRGNIGEGTQMGKLLVNVSALKPGGDDLGRWLEATVRLENATNGPIDTPTFAIYCAANPEGGGWQADSTLDMYGDVPAGSFDEGILHLLLPGDNRTGEAVPECKGPASVRAGSGTNAVDWVIPDDVLTTIGGTPAAPGATTIPPATTATTTPDDAQLANYLLTVEDLPGYVAAESDSSGDSTTEPAECGEVANLQKVKPASAKASFKQSDFGPFVFHIVMRHPNPKDAKATMSALDDLLTKCGTFVETSSDGSKTTTNMVAYETKKRGDDTWGATMTVAGGFIPAAATLVAVRKGPYVTVVMAAAVGGAATLDDALIAKAVDRLP